MARLSLTLLGGFQARFGEGPPLTLPTKKSQALLAYLARPPGREHPRDKLAALLWGDLSQGRARNSLRQALFGLRQAVESVCLRVEGPTVALNAEAVDIDAVTFERLVGERTPEALERAVGLYRGDLLEGLTLQEPPFEEWLIGERERLRELALEGLAGLLAAQRRAGAVEAALQTGLRLIALDPLQEAVHRTLMRLWAQLGRRGSALHQYQLCVGVLQRELGVEPEEETKQLYQEILQRRPVARDATVAVTSEVPPPVVSLPRGTLQVAADTAIIGRDQEMRCLRAALAEAVSVQGRVVVIVGEAGVGKTRLVAELATEIHNGTGRLLVGRCHESEQILPFGPWVDALGIGRMLASDPWLQSLPLAIRRELGRLLPDLGPEGGALAVPPDYLKLFEGMALLLGHLAERQPTVVILEDLHWADEMSVRLLAFIGHRLQAWRLLLVATAREEDLVDASMPRRMLAELEREPHVATVALGPLSRDETVGLVQALARPGSEEAAVARLGEQVWRTSGGNALVVIEAMRVAAQEALSPELEGLPVPARVRDIIGRQLDRLDERSRELVARASVIGREFEFALLQHVSGVVEEEVARAVEELTRRRVLHSVGERLDFTHDRVREVAYGRILAPRRRALHRRVAEALATLNAANLKPHHLALGLHYAEGEVWDQAVVHLRRAGVRAVERSANREAVACFERSLAALARLPDSRDTLEEGFEIRIELRSVLTRLGEVRLIRERLREAEALAERLHDDRRRGRVCALLTNCASQLGDLDQALVMGTRSLKIATRLGDARLRILTTTYLEQAYDFLGEYERVVQLAIDNLAALPAPLVHQDFDGVWVAAFDRFWLVKGLAELGRFAEAAEHEAEAIRLAAPSRHPFAAGNAYRAGAIRCISQGDWARAQPLIERAIAMLRAGNVAVSLGHAVATSAWVLAQLGEATEALDRLREAEQMLESHAAKGNTAGLNASYHALGRAALSLGRLAQAHRLGQRAIECHPGHHGYVAHACHLLGDVATHAGQFDAERAEIHYHQALALAEPRGMRPLVAHCHLGLGRLYRRAGSRDQAGEHLAIATAMYREMDMRFWLEEAEGAR